jgi:Na+/melibiose symporter-like transporter
MTLACFTSAILVLAIWLPSRSNAPIIVFAALYGFVSGALSALPEAVIPQISDLSKVKVRTGTLYGIISFAALTGNPIGGALITRNNGGFTYLQVFCGVMLAGGGVVFTVARVLQRKRKF